MTILFCTDEKFLLTSLEFRFRKNGWRLEVAHDVDNAMATFKKTHPDLVVIDLHPTGFENLEMIRNVWDPFLTGVPVLVGGPVEKGPLMMDAIRMGAHDFIISPFKPDELVLRIQRLFQMQKVED